jgi:serine/threonine protein phosphatase PrpC
MRYEIGQANRLGNRASNEDRFAAFERETSVLLVLADGMGGHAGGEWAAQALVDIANETFSRAVLPVVDPADLLKKIVERTHEAIQEFAAENDPGSPPGTTGVLCLVQDGTANWAHVGDSRLYVFREGLPLYRTRDHSYVEKLYSRGEIRRSDKSFHPMRNQITQCIGCLSQVPQVESSKPTPLCESDVILLCSDGLWGALEDMQLAAAFIDGNLEQTTQRIAEDAERNSYPHSDNISVLAMRILELKRENEEDAELFDPGISALPPLKPTRPQPEKLQDAIEQIEQVIKKYEKEMNR